MPHIRRTSLQKHPRNYRESRRGLHRLVYSNQQQGGIQRPIKVQSVYRRHRSTSLGTSSLGSLGTRSKVREASRNATPCVAGCPTQVQRFRNNAPQQSKHQPSEMASQLHQGCDSKSKCSQPKQSITRVQNRSTRSVHTTRPVQFNVRLDSATQTNNCY